MLPGETAVPARPSPGEADVEPAQGADDAVFTQLLQPPPGAPQLNLEFVQLVGTAGQFLLEFELALSQGIDRLEAAGQIEPELLDLLLGLRLLAEEHVRRAGRRRPV